MTLKEINITKTKSNDGYESGMHDTSIRKTTKSPSVGI